MTYDKKTGDVTIHDPTEQKKKKIIKNVDEVEAARQALFAELGLNQDGFPIEEVKNKEKLADKLVDVANREQNIEMDPSVFYACTNDLMRVDCGLIIQRPPIFL